MLRSILQFHQPLYRGVGLRVSPIVFVEESANSLYCVGRKRIGEEGLVPIKTICLISVN